MSQESGLSTDVGVPDSLREAEIHPLPLTMGCRVCMPVPSPDSIPSIPTEAASKHGLNLEPNSFKVSWKLFYHSKITASCSAGYDWDGG